MKALTIWQPWAWALATGLKPFENRGWVPPKSVIGEVVALHAGQTFHTEGADAIRSLVPDAFVPPRSVLPRGAIVGAARLVGYLNSTERDGAKPTHRWINLYGGYAWEFADPRSFIIPEIKGAQGLWELSPDVASRVATMYEERA